MKIRISQILLVFLSVKFAYGAPLFECLQSLEIDPQLQSISDKVPLSGKTDRLFALMGNDNYPSPQEREAIYSWGIKRDNCLSNDPQAQANTPLTQVSRNGFNGIQALISDLYKGNISYGLFARRSQEVVNETYVNIERVTGRGQSAQLPPPQPQYQQQQRDPLYNPYYKQPQQTGSQYTPPVRTVCRWDAYFKETVCETK